MIVVGLDLSLTCTGLAVGYSNGHVASLDTHRVKSVGKKGASANEMALRIGLMQRQILSFVFGEDGTDHEIDLAVIESPSFGSNGGAAHERGGLWWSVASVLAECFPIATVAPKTRAIYAVGHGSGKGAAGKREVKEAVIARYGHLGDIPDDNVADATVLAAMGLRHLGQPIDDLPATHTRAMESAKWPN